MVRITRGLGPAAALALSISITGCSQGTGAPIDVKSTIQKASGGDGKARQSEKAKAASDAASTTHPKLH